MFGQLVAESSNTIRKRRRPALSCIECRRRKIKCDRNSPCNHCKQSKKMICSYKESHPAIQSNRILNTNRSLAPSVTGFNERLNNSSSPSSNSMTSASRLSGPSAHTTTTTNSHSHGKEQTESETYQSTLERVKLLSKGLPDAMNNIVLEDGDMLEGQKALGLSFSTFNDVIVQDGTLITGKIRTKYFDNKDETPIEDLKGNQTKTKYIGKSHWMQSFEQFKVISTFRKQAKSPELSGANNDVKILLEKCKLMARKAKAQRPSQWHMNPDLKNYVPARGLADQLVEYYLRTMESNYRIVHIPSFRKEYEGYWDNPQDASTTTVVKILLVMAIGSSFYQETDHESVRSAAQQWVYSAQSWVSAPFEKARLNLSGLQVQCLLLLARQTTGVGGDMVWIAAGTLLRSAFQMGFHRDPTNFPKMSILHQELRRRLWATVLEMTMQTSLDGGMPPLINLDDFDTQPPSNVDDEDISETTTIPPIPKPMNIYTRASLQILLMKAFPIRFAIVKCTNNFHIEPSYEEILRYSTELVASCKEATVTVSSYSPTLPKPAAIQSIHLDLFLRRFIMALHQSSAMKSLTDPRYYFSRKMCVDTAMRISTHTGEDPDLPTPPGKMNDYTRLKCIGTGFYKEINFQTGSLVALELLTILEEEQSIGLLSSEAQARTRLPLYNVVRDLVSLAATRIVLGENNGKIHIFASAVLAQIEALEKGEDVEQAILSSACKSARYCLELLSVRTNIPTTPSVKEVALEEPDFADFVMGDSPDFNFDMADPWLFTGWEEPNNNSW